MLFAINVGWYFDLHWHARINSKMTDGYDVHLCMAKPGKHNNNVHEINLKRSSVGFFNNMKTFYQMYKTFCKVKPDLIHSVTIKPNLMLGLIALIYRKPILITIPGLGSLFSQNTIHSKLAANVIILLYRLISINKKAAFVFENKTDLELFKKKRICRRANGYTVPGSGVDINEYSAPKLNIDSSDGLNLLFAARLLRGKGLYELVDAVSSLRKKGVKVSLNVAGIIDDDSNDAIPLNVLENWHKQNKINWLGQVDEGMTDVIAQNDVIVLPTRYGEGLPRILIEANACRRPVITTDIGGCRDFVQDGINGIIVGICDPQALELAITRLTDRVYSAQLGENGRKRVEEFYTDNHVIVCYQNIYRSLIE